MRHPISIGVSSLAVLALALTGCSSTSAQNAAAQNCTPAHENLETIRPGVLTVAQYEYPPFAYKEGGELVGLEGEVMQRIAELECLEIEIVAGDASAMITSVQTGRADTTLGSWYRTKERSEVVRLSKPVVTSPISVVSTTGISTLDEIAELDSVGTGQALVGIEELQALYGDKLKLYPSNDALFSDLQAGRIQGAIVGLGAAITQMELYSVDGAEAHPIEADERFSATVDVGQTNFPVNPSNEALGQAIDEHIEALREEGFIAELADKYGFPAEVADPGMPNLL